MNTGHYFDFTNVEILVTERRYFTWDEPNQQIKIFQIRFGQLTDMWIYYYYIQWYYGKSIKG